MRSLFGLLRTGLVIPVCLGLSLLTAGNLFLMQGNRPMPGPIAPDAGSGGETSDRPALLPSIAVAAAEPGPAEGGADSPAAKPAKLTAASQALVTLIDAADKGPDQRPVPALKPVSSKLVLALQRELAAAGYQAGGETGVLDLMTRGAILAFEQDHGLPLTAEPSETVFKALLGGVAPVPKSKQQKTELASGARAVIKRTQGMLRKLGYRTGEEEGVVSDQTARSIRQFESASGLPPTGRVSGVLLAELARLSRSPLDVAASELPQ